MKVSIIIPIYNVKDYLKECIDSVLMQTFRNFEVLLIDDVPCKFTHLIFM